MERLFCFKNGLIFLHKKGSIPIFHGNASFCIKSCFLVISTCPFKFISSSLKYIIIIFNRPQNTPPHSRHQVPAGACLADRQPRRTMRQPLSGRSSHTRIQSNRCTSFKDVLSITKPPLSILYIISFLFPLKFLKLISSHIALLPIFHQQPHSHLHEVPEHTYTSPLLLSL